MKAHMKGAHRRPQTREKETAQAKAKAATVLML